MPRTASQEAPPTKPSDNNEVPKFKGKLPKSLAGCADRLYVVRKERLELASQVVAMKSEENALREHLINNLPKSSATGIAGRIARASIETKTVYVPEDWDRVHDHIVKNCKKDPGVWALLQRRLGEAACKEVFEAGRKIPGVGVMEVPVVSLNKL